MLNIEDIKAKIKRNPEPQEVTDMRNLITTSFSKLQFVEEGHHYYLPMNDGTVKELKSVSHFTHQFEEKKDWDEITRKYAIKNGRTFEEVKEEWHVNNITSTTRGTKTHFYGEMMANLFLGKEDLVRENMPMSWEDGYLIPYCPKEEAVEKFWSDLIKINDVWVVMPETKVYTNMNDKYDFKVGIAGTFDLLLACRVNNKIVYVIADYKTNKDLCNSYNQQFNKTLLDPFSDFIEEPKSMYTLQQSTYQAMLSQLDIDIVDRRLIWLKEDGTYEKIPVPDITQRILNFCC